MQLHIHCGLHKTGTSTFQQFLDSNCDSLATLGVLYPKYKFWQHGGLAWLLQEGREDEVRSFLSSARQSANACHSVLISGEDFENYIYDLYSASNFEKIAYEVGFESVCWHVVWRETAEYVDSLYGELSKHGLLINKKFLVTAAKKRGVFFASHENYNFIFILDYERFRQRFKNSVTEVKEYSFDNFKTGLLGSILLQEVIAPDEVRKFMSENAITRRANQRETDLQIELNYLSTSLGLPWLKRRRYRPIGIPTLYSLKLARKLSEIATISLRAPWTAPES